MRRRSWVKERREVSLLTGTKAQHQDKVRELDANSRRRAVAPLNTLLRWEGLDKVLTAPPADRPEPEYLTPQEVQAVVKAMKNPAERYACLAAFATGARYGELFAMTRFSLRGKSQTHIHIDKQRLRDWSLTRTKNGKIGNAFILKSYRANLLKWLDVDQKTKQEMRRIGLPYDSFKMACATVLGRDLKVIDDILKRLTAYQTIHNYVAPMRCKDGSIKQVAISSNVYRENGEFVHTRCFSHDITAQWNAERGRRQAEEKIKKAAEDLSRSNKELEQFAHILSHDLNEPLRSVKLYVELIKKRSVGKLDPKAEEFMGYAVAGTQRMQDLIEDLLKVSRVGTHRPDFKKTELGGVLEAVTSNLEVLIAETGAKVTSEALPTVQADSTELMQVFQNLIANAIKFRGNEPPRIHLSANKCGTEWKIEVKDNGIGIEPEFKAKIFEMFQRLHSKEQYPGTGAGLAICKKIIERHGGRINVDSTPGKGSTFHFTLPN